MTSQAEEEFRAGLAILLAGLNVPIPTATA